MSKLKTYVDLHRKSRSKMMSISDFNKEYDATLPENKVAEERFHARIKKLRNMSFPVRGSVISSFGQELGLIEKPVRKSTFLSQPRSIKRSVKNSMKGCGCAKNCSCSDDSEKMIQPSKVKMRRSMKLKLKSAPTSVAAAPAPKMQASKRLVSHHRGPKRHHKGFKTRKTNPPTGHGNPKIDPSRQRSSIGRMTSSLTTKLRAQPVEKHSEFNVESVTKFYQQYSPDYLKENNVAEEVEKWNQSSAEFVLSQLREKYDAAPGDLWKKSEVVEFYERVRPSMLQEHDVDELMNRWRIEDKNEMQSKLKEQYGSYPTEHVAWTPETVEKFYGEVNPSKLDEKPSFEIANEWNMFSVGEIQDTCRDAYGIAPEPACGSCCSIPNENKNNLNAYQKNLHESSESFDAMKIIHFVPQSGEVPKHGFKNFCAKFRQSTAEMLAKKGETGPIKMMSGTHKTFKSLNREDVKQVFKQIANGKEGHFFIRSN